MRVVVRDQGRLLEGDLRPGESWAAAARRVAGGREPEPVDLSRPSGVWTVEARPSVVARPMGAEDLDQVIAWRTSEAVQEWWAQGELADHAQMRDKYLERVEGNSPTRMWIVEVADEPAGFVQDYRIGDYPDYARLGPDPQAVGIDYALGSDRWRGQGLGPRLLWAWLRVGLARHDGVRRCFAGPDARNPASLRILAKAGFVEQERFSEPQPDGSEITVVGCYLDLARVSD